MKPLQIVTVMVILAALCAGCVVTQTTDIGQPWIRVNSASLKPGVTTAEQVVALMGLPFKIVQGDTADSEVYFYINVRRREKTFLIPPILPIYTLTRLSERKGVVLVVLKKRIVTQVTWPTDDKFLNEIPQSVGEGLNIGDLLK